MYTKSETLVGNYNKAIKSIENNEMFHKTFTVNGITKNLSEFFNSSEEIVEYYHKVEGNTHFFVKIFGGKDGILFKLDFIANNIVTSFENTTKTGLTVLYDYKYLKTKDED